MDKILAVSIIVPVYNGETTIDACLKSLLALNYPKEKMELIVVNNASTDGTAEILQRYAADMRILFEKKRGPAAARNKGLVNATGTVIAFTDADCIVDREWLTTIVSSLQDGSIGIVGGKILSTRPANKIALYGEKIHDHRRAINEFKPPYAITMNWASRLAVLQKFGLFDDEFIRGEDSDLSLRIYRAGYRIVYEPRAIIYHKNVNTYGSLFRKGYLHGFHSMKLYKKGSAHYQHLGHHRLPRLHKTIEQDIKRCLNQRSVDSLCDLIFNLGKAWGKLLGYFRFARVHG